MKTQVGELKQMFGLLEKQMSDVAKQQQSTQKTSNMDKKDEGKKKAWKKVMGLQRLKFD